MKIEQIVFDEKNPIICPVCKKILMSDGGDMDMPEACEHVLAWYNDFDQGGWCNIKPYVEKEIRRLCGRRKGDKALAYLFNSNPSVILNQTTYYIGGGCSVTETIAFLVDGCMYVWDEK